MNPENPTHNPEDEVDDSPYAETNRLREQYQINLKNQRKNIAKEEEDSLKKDNIIQAPHRFKQVSVPEPSPEQSNAELAKKVVAEYRKRQFVRELKEQNQYDAYINLSQEEKDKKFLDWKSNLK